MTWYYFIFHLRSQICYICKWWKIFKWKVLSDNVNNHEIENDLSCM